MNIVRSNLLSFRRQALTQQTIRFRTDWKLRHHYNVLGVKTDSSPEQIRQSFLELAKIYHPDNPETGNQAKFMRIQNSYEKIKEAPFWVDGSVSEDILTHEEFIKKWTIDPAPIRNFNKGRFKFTRLRLYKV